MGGTEVFRIVARIQTGAKTAIAELGAVHGAGAKMATKLRASFRAITKFAKIAFVAVGVAAAAIFVSAIKKAADFELGMAKVKAISGATAEEFAALTEEAERLGLVTAQSMTDIAEGMEAFARAGFDADQIISAMSGAVALAESQVMDLGSAVQITAGVLNGMRLPAEEANRVVNALAAAASSSATTVESLGESMKYLGPAAADLGIPLEEALAIVGKLGDAGLRGGLATRAFSTALSAMASPTEEAATVMEDLGIKFFDANGEFIGITNTVGVLEVALEGMTVEQKKVALGAMFTGAAVRTFSVLLGVGAEELANYQEELTDTTVAFDQQAAMLETLKGQWKILKGSIELLLVTIGNDMMPILENLLRNRIIPLVNSITGWIKEQGGLLGVIENTKKKIREWADEHPLLSSAIKATLDILKGLTSFIVNVFQGDWADAWEDVKNVTRSAADFIEDAVTTAWNALPISDEIKTKIVNVFIWIKDKAIEAWAGLRASIEEHGGGIITAWVAIKDAAVNLWDALGSVFNSIMGLFGETGDSAITFGDVVKGVFDIVLIVVETSLGGIADLFNIIASLLRGDWSQAWEDWKNFLDGIWDGVLKILDVVGLRNMLANAWEWIKQDAITAWTRIGDFFNNIWASITGAFKAAIDWVKSIVPKFIRDWLGWGEESAEAYAEGLESKEDEVKDAGEKLGEAAVEGAKMSEAEIKQAGEDLAESLTTGFTSGVDGGRTGAFTAGEELGEAAIEGLGFGIDAKSPSGEAYTHGLNLTDGFEDGIKEGTPGVIEAVTDLTKRTLALFNEAVGESKISFIGWGKWLINFSRELTEDTLDELKDFVDGVKEHMGNFLSAIGDSLARNTELRRDYEEERRRIMEGGYENEAELLKEAEKLYEENRMTIWEILKEGVRDFLKALREKLLLKAAEHLAIAIAQALLLLPTAVRHFAAAAAYLAGGLGLAIAGFQEGGIAMGPMLGVVGEGPEPELMLPLSRSVLVDVGRGIVEASQPGMSMSSQEITIHIAEGATFHVREEGDIDRISHALGEEFTIRMWEEGVVPA